MIFTIPPRYSTVPEPFAFWQDFLTEEDIELLLSMPQWQSQHAAQIEGGVTNLEARVTEISSWYPCEKTRHIWDKIVNVVAQVNAQFFQFDLTGCCEPAQFGTYNAEDGGHYGWHTDVLRDVTIAPRKLSMVLMLSDPSEFEGGELHLKTFSDDVTNVEQKRGRAFFFPSYTLHRVTPVTKGVRRSLVLWIAGPPFK